MIISDTWKSLEDKNEKIDLSVIKKFLKILSVLLMIFTTIYFTCFGCFLVLNDSTSWAAHTVTLSGEGPAAETYPDLMGEYQLAEEEISSSAYRRVDRNDTFLMYNKFGTSSDNTI